jgi:hypothetical protein
MAGGDRVRILSRAVFGRPVLREIVLCALTASSEPHEYQEDQHDTDDDRDLGLEVKAARRNDQHRRAPADVGGLKRPGGVLRPVGVPVDDPQGTERKRNPSCKMLGERQHGHELRDLHESRNHRNREDHRYRELAKARISGWLLGLALRSL